MKYPDSIKLRWDDISRSQDAQNCRSLWEKAHEYGFEQLLACVPVNLEENMALVEVVREFLGNGDKLGLHGYRHEAFPSLSPQEQEEQMKAGLDILLDLFGVFPLFFVPPYKMYNKVTERIAGELGMQIETSQANFRRYCALKHDERRPSYIIYHPQWMTPENLEKDLEFLRREGMR